MKRIEQILDSSDLYRIHPPVDSESLAPEQSVRPLNACPPSKAIEVITSASRFYVPTSFPGSDIFWVQVAERERQHLLTALANVPEDSFVYINNESRHDVFLMIDHDDVKRLWWKDAHKRFVCKNCKTEN